MVKLKILYLHLMKIFQIFDQIIDANLITSQIALLYLIILQASPNLCSGALGS